MKLSKDHEGKDIQPDWHQSEIIHCPDHKCDGMLLQSIYYYPMKCSKCGKLWTRYFYMTCNEKGTLKIKEKDE